MKLNEEICEFIGAFIGDGHFGVYGPKKNSWVVGIVGNRFLDEDYIKNHLKFIVKKNFININPRIYYRNDENTIRLILNSKKLVLLFLDLGFKFGKKSQSAVIPEIITQKKNFLKFTIKGIFDTDGSVFFDKRSIYNNPYPRICLKLKNPVLIGQIHTLLKDVFGIKSTINKDYGRIQINGKYQLLRFNDMIGFSNKRHYSKIDKIKASAGTFNSKVYDFPL